MSFFLKERKISRNGKEGQSLVEFTFVILIFMAMLSLTFNAILAFCTQQYLSFAAFMAARAYQASNATMSQQRSHAERVLLSYLDVRSPTILKFPSFNRILAKNIQYSIPEPEEGVFIPLPTDERRIRITFEVPFLEFPLGSLRSNFGTVQLQAESYLGREPTQDRMS